MGMVAKGGTLGPDAGFVRYENSAATSLPLLDVENQAVAHLIQYVPGTGTNTVQLAVTKKTSSGTGHVWEYASNSWTEVVWSGTGSTIPFYPAEFDGDNGVRGDWTYVPFMNTEPTTASAGLGGKPGVHHGQIMFTDGNNAEGIYVYPDGDNHYFGFEQSVFNNNFSCVTIEVWADRVFFGNLNEDNVLYKHRLRWCAPGNTTVDIDVNTLGAGFLDLERIDGGILRIETIGDYLAIYAEDAIAFASRTGISTLPIRVDYLSEERGVLSTHCVAELGSGEHFLVATDGWFILDSSGRMRELGLSDVGGRLTRRWIRTFYDSFNYEQRHTLNTVYDLRNRRVKVAWSDNDAEDNVPNRIWNYDLDTDRVWEDAYIGNEPITMAIFEGFTDQTTWATATTDWENYAPQQWDVRDAVGSPRIVHGTPDGLIFEHSPSLATRDGERFIVSATSHKSNFGDTAALQFTDKMWIEYISTGSSDGISFSIDYDDASITQSVKLNKSNSGTNQSTFINAHQSMRRLGWSVSGLAPYYITGIDFEIAIEGDSTQEKE
jgi:hypothetical protein